MKKSINIILEQYKKENITEEEVIKLIEDLYVNNRWNTVVYPTYPVTYTDTFPKYEVTCNATK